MNTSFRSAGLLAATAVTLLLALTGCNRNDGETIGQKVDKGIAKTAEAGREVKQNAKEAAREVGDASRNAANKASSETKEAANESRTAVMGAGSETKTSVGQKIDDAGITMKVKTGLSADKDLSATKIDVDTKDGVVTLTGTAPTADAKTRAADIAKNVKDVKSVNNQLTVKAG
jgi:hyperosmotically inducible periplasmic protein